MRSLATKLTAFLSCLLISGIGTSFADTSQITAMQDQIRALNQQLAAVENKLSNMNSQAARPAVVASDYDGGFFQTAKDIKVGGHIDVQYNQNLTRGGNAIAGGNTGRIFDNDRESFTVNQVELNFEREANPEGGAGFRIDLSMGEDAGVVDADATGGADDFDVQQAYIEYVQPLSFFEDSEYLPSSVTFTAGRFVTLAGLEVIEPQDNWNISRTFTFGTVIPFVHTGARMNFGLFNDYFDVTIGVLNGWGLPVDNNQGKTAEFGIGWAPIENVSMYHTFYFGNENASTGGGSGGFRFLNTNTITYDATDKLAFMGEANFGQQRRAVTSGENVEWYSLAAYARYQVTEKDAVAARYEWVHDQQTFLGNVDRTVQSYTLTYERMLADDLIGRAEYRLDHGSASGFGGDAGQQTFGFEMIYIIG